MLRRKPRIFSTTKVFSSPSLNRSSNQESRIYSSSQAVSDPELIVVGVAISQKFCSFKFENTMQEYTPVKQFTMTVLDGNDEMVTLKVDTSLNQSMSLIEKGPVLRLTAFVPIYFCYSHPTDLNVVILVSTFRKIAQIEVDPKLVLAAKQQERKPQRMKAAAPAPPPNPPKLPAIVQPEANV